MRRALPILLLFAMLLVPAAQPGAIAADIDDVGDQFRIEIRNRSGHHVVLTLAGLDLQAAYRLVVPAGTEQAFTVKAGRYAQTTFACGGTAAGTLEVSRQLRLTFTPCASAAPNGGAPRLEKVHLTDSPSGKKWLYQYGYALLGLGPAFSSSAAGSCQFTASADVTIYNRPDTAAQVFSAQGAGFTIQPTARAAGGWLGFDPGVAQAANIGPFRLRWLPPGSGTLSSGCASLPVVWVPRAGICYTMPMFDTTVHASPDAGSAALFVLHLGEFAQVQGLAPGGDWAQVDLGPGNTGSNVVGWVESNSLNVNCPCGSLPTINP